MVRQNIAPTKPISTAPPKSAGDNILQSIIGHIKALREEVRGVKEQDIPYMKESIALLEGNIQKLAESVNAQRYYIEQMHRYHLSLKQIAASLDAMSTEYLNLTMPAQPPEEPEYPGMEEPAMAEEPEPGMQEPMSLEDLEAQVSGVEEPEEPEPEVPSGPAPEEPIRPMPTRKVPASVPPEHEVPPVPKPKKEPKLTKKSAADIIKQLEANIDDTE